MGERNLPVLADIGQVIGDDRPNDSFRAVGLAITDQPVAVSDQSDGPKRRAVTLGAAPVTIKAGTVNIILGFTQTLAGRQKCARWVGDRLEDCLRMKIVFDILLQARLTKQKLVNDHLQSQS